MTTAAWPGPLGKRDNEGVAERLSAPEIVERLTSLDGWAREGETLRKSFRCASFPDAIAFVVRVAFLAEAANHHPDIDVRWRTVHLTLSTHDAGGLTRLDFELAQRIDEAAAP